jgi:hypothetical protein
MAMDTATARIEVLRIVLMESLNSYAVIKSEKANGLAPSVSLSGPILPESLLEIPHKTASG